MANGKIKLVLILVVAIGGFVLYLALGPDGKINTDNIGKNWEKLTAECSGQGKKDANGVCICNSGWKGTTCETKDTTTADDECSGQGKKSLLGVCICNSGWKGTTCETKDTTTADDECSGQGKKDADGVCVCNSGWKGTTCETKDTEEDLCVGVTCSNGTCVGGVCQCQNGWTGDKCDQIVGGSEGDGALTCPTCKNGGTCNTTTGVCNCLQGFTGVDCGSKVCPTCKNGGTCDGTTGACKCNTGYTGVDCGDIVCPTCRNGGTCDSTTGKCICTGGYSGNDCSIAPTVSCPNDCSGNGSCDTVTGKCTCTTGFIGDACGIKTIVNGFVYTPIRASASYNKCITADSVTGKITLELDKGDSNQRWTLTTDGYLVAGYNSNKCLTINNGTMTNVNKVVSWDKSNTAVHQRWTYENGRLRSQKDPNYCIQYHTQLLVGSDVVIYTIPGSGFNQLWTVEGVCNGAGYKKTDGTCVCNFGQHGSACQLFTKYKFQPGIPELNQGSINSYYSLDLNNGNVANAENIKMWRTHNHNAQNWYYTKTGVIRSALNNSYCIDWDTYSPNIQLYQCNGLNNQQFEYNDSTKKLKSIKDQSKCMNIDGNITDNANVMMSDCTTSTDWFPSTNYTYEATFLSDNTIVPEYTVVPEYHVIPEFTVVPIFPSW